MATHDPYSVALEIREQLSSEKRRLGFFFGAGTSMAVGLPGIDHLTEKVCEELQEPDKAHFVNVKNELKEGSNVEDVLNRIRLYRELIGDSEEEEHCGIKGSYAARMLDSAICHMICKIISKDPPYGLDKHLIFAQWLKALHCNRCWPVEIFTTNYDLLFEKAMESYGIPFFDGFIGSVAPFFAPESVEAEEEKMNETAYPPRTWTRLWKLHGSINWYLQKDTSSSIERITRFSGLCDITGKELVIFPSRDKYIQSRKLPFITYQDRLTKFLSSGERLVFIIGYSFSDEHLNSIMFQGLRSNPRLAITAFIHSELPAKMIEYGKEFRNLTLYGPDRACIGGKVAPWSEPSRKPKETEAWAFWNDNIKSFALGDFKSFALFLEEFIAFGKSTIDNQRSPLPLKDMDLPSREKEYED